jgi:hypothetical protein
MSDMGYNESMGVLGTQYSVLEQAENKRHHPILLSTIQLFISINLDHSYLIIPISFSKDKTWS